MTGKPVVVGVDGSAAALCAVRWAAGRASHDDRPLRIVHAYELPLGFPTGVTEEESILNGLRLQGRRWLASAQETSFGAPRAFGPRRRRAPASRARRAAASR